MALPDQQKALLAQIRNAVAEDPAFARAVLATLPPQTQGDLHLNLLAEKNALARDLDATKALLRSIPTKALFTAGHCQIASRIESALGDNLKAMAYLATPRDKRK